MDLDVLHSRLFMGISVERIQEEYFYLSVPQYRLKHHLEFKCDKDILHGQNCFKCCYNLHPDRKVGTKCGIVNHVFAGRSDAELFINYPQKSVCAFCKIR